EESIRRPPESKKAPITCAQVSRAIGSLPTLNVIQLPSPTAGSSSPVEGIGLPSTRACWEDASCGWNSAEALVAAKPRSSRRRLSGDICPEADFDVVVEIFTQFSSPAERALKWSGMKRSLKSGGLLIIQGYTPKQLEYGTGGPKQIENLYTRAILERAFPEFRVLSIVEEECEIHEGTSHGGMSAVINLTATKP